MSIGLPLCPLIFLSLSDESDRQFLEQLYIKYHRVMIRMAHSLCSSEADAEDIVSESLIALAGKISVIKDLECSVLEGYVISVVKHTAYAHFIHTHPLGSLKGITRFSFPDKSFVIETDIPLYVCGPDGELRKYIGTGNENGVIIAKDIKERSLQYRR